MFRSAHLACQTINLLGSAYLAVLSDPSYALNMPSRVEDANGSQRNFRVGFSWASHTCLVARYSANQMVIMLPCLAQGSEMYA